MNRYLVTYRRWFSLPNVLSRLEVDALSKAEALEKAKEVILLDREVNPQTIKVEKKLQVYVSARKSHRKRATFWVRLLQDRIV